MKTTAIIVTVGLLLTTVFTGVALFEALKHNTPTPYHDNLNKIAEEINSLHTTWKAGVNSRWVNSDIAGVKAQMGVLEGEPNGINVETVDDVLTELPDTFDAREQWGSQCPSLWEVRD